MLGGPLGAMLGAAFGHQFDIDGPAPASSRPRHRVGDQERVQAAFFTATFAVMGRLAKADGQVSRAEIVMAEQVMTHMRLDATQRQLAKRLFNEGRQAGFPLDDVLQQFRRECHGRSTLIRMFLEIQIQAALADGSIAPEESTILETVARALGVNSGDLERLIDMMRGAEASHGRDEGMSLSNAHRILGVNANTPLPEVRKAYRRLLGQHHPDKLVSKGLPEEMIKIANEKTHEIRMAWERVKQARRAA